MKNMKNIKIAIIAPIAWRTPPKEYGPWELVASNLTEGLVKKGYDVTLFATADSITNAKLHHVCKRGYEEDKTINPDVWKLLHVSEVFERAEEFDIIHNHFDFPPLTYSRLVDTPVVTTIHGFSSEVIYPVYEKYNNNSFYVSISNADRYEKLDYVATVYNGIDLNKFHYNPKGDDDQYLVYLGRICHEKGTYEAIQIARKANKKLIIAGLIQEPEYYEKKVKPFIDNKQISYLGMIPDEQVSILLGKAWCLLHPVMRPERFGLTMAESMACGTPVIGFAKGSVSEVVEHGKTGYVVNTIDEAVENIKKLDDIKRKDCRIRVERYFTVEKMVEEYIQVYENIINQIK